MPDPTAEEIAAKAVEEATKTEDKQEEKSEAEKVEEKVSDPHEAAARADGWLPKEEYKGDPEKWVDPKTWVEKGPLLKRISSQSTHIKELKKTVDAMAKHFTANVNHAVATKIAELKSQRTEAIKEGDVDKVEKLDAAIDKQKEAKADIPTAPELAPEIKDWVAANKWYATDMELHDFALAYNDSYLKRHPDDLAASLDATTRAVKRAFPEKFSGEAKPTVTKPGPSAVEGSTAPSGAGKKFTVSRLSPDQKLAHDQYVKAGTFKKQAEAAKMTGSEWYIRDLDSIGELSR
jgi:hypothetical protein